MPINNVPPKVPCFVCENNHYHEPYARLEGKVFCARRCWEEAVKLAEAKGDHAKLH